ncbi:hypothetical protein Taro_020290 [Colocasia esculenta]|uniref:Uncharacterized protein n=1 Tax=Colocasia esculenta TaxID=4460 RepID=A0A843UZ77_COLES|nr:hypothetical protein [Colocasia esculenta]
MHVGLDTDVYKSTGIVPCNGTFSSLREHALILRNPLPRKLSTDLGIGGFPRSSPAPPDPLLVLQVFVLTALFGRGYKKESTRSIKFKGPAVKDRRRHPKGASTQTGIVRTAHHPDERPEYDVGTPEQQPRRLLGRVQPRKAALQDPSQR